MTQNAFAAEELSEHKNQLLGRCGEYIAANFLQAKKYRIIEQNWRHSSGEIDLITLYGTTFVFVEVKTRTGTDFGHPFEGLTEQKFRRLHRLAAYWIKKYSARNVGSQKTFDYRLDLIGIVFRKDGLELSHQQGLLP